MRSNALLLKLSLCFMVLIQGAVIAEESKIGEPLPSRQAQGQSQAPAQIQAPAQPSAPVETPDTPADRAYKQQMIQISNQIDQKIAQIKVKQKEIDEELYPAFVPPLMSDMRDLHTQLRALEMQRDQIQTEKASNDMRKQLSKPQQ